MSTVLPRRFRVFLSGEHRTAIDEQILEYLDGCAMVTKKMLLKRLRCHRKDLDHQLGLLEGKGIVKRLSIGTYERYFLNRDEELGVASSK